VQLITICAVVKTKCAVEKGNVCPKKCRDSGQNDDLRADYQVLCSCKPCLKYTLKSSSILIVVCRVVVLKMILRVTITTNLLIIITLVKL